MVPQPSSIHDRAQEYKKHGMYVHNDPNSKSKVMLCEFCDTRINWEKKSTIENHCKSGTHQTKKRKAEENDATATGNSRKKRQISIGSSFATANKMKEDKERFILSLTQAFLRANIPLEKLDDPAIREFLSEFIPGSGDLPGARWIRENYVPKIKKDYDEKVKLNLRGKKIIIHCDETTNKKGEAVFLVLFKILPEESDIECQLIVASVTILSACTGDQCSKAIIKALTAYDVDFPNVVALSSDSAAYMNLCFRLLKELVNPDLIHLQCWAHKLDKVFKIFINKLPRLNECVSKCKKLFKNTRKRKNRYFKFLTDKYSFSGKKSPKLFPLPVMTRWGSWGLSAKYLFTYLEDIVEYCKTLSQTEKEVKAVDYFSKLSNEDVKIIKAEAAFIIDYASPVSDLLLLLEGSKFPFAHKLYAKLGYLRTTFSLVKNTKEKDLKTVLFPQTAECLTALSDSKQKGALYRFRSVCIAAYDMIKKMIMEDPANEFYNAAQILFCPDKLAGIIDESAQGRLVSSAKQKIKLLDDIESSQFIVMHSIFRDEVVDKLKSYDPKKLKSEGDLPKSVLVGMRATLSNSLFVSRCMQVIHISVSNVDSERGFSVYGDVMSSKRCNLKPPNAEVMMCLYFGDGDQSNEYEREL